MNKQLITNQQENVEDTFPISAFEVDPVKKSPYYHSVNDLARIAYRFIADSGSDKPLKDLKIQCKGWYETKYSKTSIIKALIINGRLYTPKYIFREPKDKLHYMEIPKRQTDLSKTFMKTKLMIYSVIINPNVKTYTIDDHVVDYFDYLVEAHKTC